MPCQECAVLSEVLEVLVGHVGLDAGGDPSIQKLLEQVYRLWIVVVLNDHHWANDRDNVGSGEEID